MNWILQFQHELPLFTVWVANEGYIQELRNDTG